MTVLLPTERDVGTTSGLLGTPAVLGMTDTVPTMARMMDRVDRLPQWIDAGIVLPSRRSFRRRPCPPLLRRPGRQIFDLTHGFASRPRDRFAFIGKRLVVQSACVSTCGGGLATI